MPGHLFKKDSILVSCFIFMFILFSGCADMSAVIEASDHAAKLSENKFTIHAVSVIDIGPFKRVFSASYRPGNPQVDDANIYLFYEKEYNSGRLRLYLNDDPDNSRIEDKINQLLPEIIEIIPTLQTLVEEITGYYVPVNKYDIIYFPQHSDHKYGIKLKSYSNSFGPNQTHQLRFGFVVDNNDLTHKQLVRDIITTTSHELVHVAFAFNDIHISSTKEERYAYLAQSCIEYRIFGSILSLIDRDHTAINDKYNPINKLIDYFSDLYDENEALNSLYGMQLNNIDLLSSLDDNSNIRLKEFLNLCKGLSNLTFD